LDMTAIRRQIAVCRQMIYMNTGWQGPSPIPVVEAVKERLDYESYQGPTSPAVLESGRALKLKARQSVAELLNVSAEEIAPTQSTTEGLNMVLNGLDWQQGDEIVTCDLEHPSVLLPAYFLQQRRGVEVKVLPMAPAEDHSSIVEKVAQALTPRTRLLFISHIQYSTGICMPVEELRELTRHGGVWMLLDAAQAAGQVALDLRRLDCEFYSIPGQKWLLGPAGTGALYIRRDMIPHVRPAKVASHAALSYDREGGLEPDLDSIEKFDLTTTSAPLWAGLGEAIRFNLEVGPKTVEERILALSAMLKEELAEIPGITLLSPLDGPGCTGLVTFSIAGVEEEAAVSHLWEKHRIVCRSVAYPQGLRLSLCFFNTEEEVEQAAEAVKKLAKSGL